MKFAGLFTIMFCIFLFIGLVPAIFLKADIWKIEMKKLEESQDRF